MIGNYACGSRALGYGKTSDVMEGLELIAGTGERLNLRRGDDLRTHPSPIVQAWIIAACPIVTYLPTFTPKLSARCTIVPSWTLLPSPISMELMSPRSTQLCHTLDLGPRWTSPNKIAPRAT